MKPALTTLIALVLIAPLTNAATQDSISIAAPDSSGSDSWGSAYDTTALAPAITGATDLGLALVPGWEIREADHICGLKSANQLSNPAKIDFDDVMAATTEMKTLKRDGIDPSSPRGQQLVNRATRRVTDAAKTVMGEGGYCSVWKNISHTDGRDVTDVSAEVRRNL
ncbi:hypothetical protein [Engelhardtia mirabilis]|uniref:Uncharacterized protein n=1 Tax=Engelhardtia mirabilis TaxID=2528011 RepID=A0A518BPX7_9BACT|nr:hypothetical protein Pla133_41190 [Planctomycetes bacterium Pla133]QDV03330.1 hypothetical protein Pla86_41180 [Planctomycetes bacterium Pla86]